LLKRIEGMGGGLGDGFVVTRLKEASSL
jgi:hypothetical protein